MKIDKSFLAFLALLVFLPIPFASENDWLTLLTTVWGGLLLLSVCGQILAGTREPSKLLSRTWLMSSIWFVWLVYVLGQTFYTLALAAQTYGLDNDAVIMRLSQLDTYAYSLDHSQFGVLQSFFYFSLFVLTLLFANQQKNLRWLAWTLVLSGTAQALYGAVMTLSGLEYGFFIEKASKGVASGTFINRNHFANYLVMCLSVGIGLLIAHLGEASGGSWRARLRAFIHWILSPKMLLRLMLVLMVIALVLSRSRMGNSSFFIAMLAAGVIALLLSRYATRSVTILLISLIIIDIFIVGTWFGLEQVKQRIEETTVQTETRDEVSLDSLEYWQDYFWTGSGLGSYRYVIPKYQHVYLTGWFDQAHNDYLQFGAETGFLGLSLVAMLLLFSLFAAVIAQLRRRNPLLRGLGFAATMGILALLIHAHVEFNFQITANAATAVVLMALAWVALYAPRQSRRQPQQHDHHHHHTRHQSRSHGVNGLSALGRNVSILGIVVSVLITLTAVIWLKAHIAASHAEYYLKHESQTDTDWQEAKHAIDHAIRLNPWRASYHLTRAQVILRQPEAARQDMDRQALAAITDSLRYQPANAIHWANFVIMKTRLGEYDQTLRRALMRATETGRPFLHVHQTVLRTGLTAWMVLNHKERLAILNFFELGLKESNMRQSLLEIWRTSPSAAASCRLNAPITQWLEVCRQLK